MIRVSFHAAVILLLVLCLTSAPRILWWLRRGSNSDAPVAADAERRVRQGVGDKQNQAAQLHNARIHEMIAGLKAEAQFTARVVSLDIYRILDNLIEDGGTIELSGLCHSRFVSDCDDVFQNFFDSYHPTERAYAIVAKDMFDNYGKLFLL